MGQFEIFTLPVETVVGASKANSVVLFPRVPSHPNAASRMSKAEYERYLELLGWGYGPDLALTVLGRVPCNGGGDGLSSRSVPHSQ